MEHRLKSHQKFRKIGTNFSGLSLVIKALLMPQRSIFSRSAFTRVAEISLATKGPHPSIVLLMLLFFLQAQHTDLARALLAEHH